MEELSVKELKSEGFKTWAKYKKENDNYIEQDNGDFSLMLFPIDEEIFKKYKNRDVYSINNEKLTTSGVDNININEEDNRYGCAAFGLMLNNY